MSDDPYSPQLAAIMDKKNFPPKLSNQDGASANKTSNSNRQDAVSWALNLPKNSRRRNVETVFKSNNAVSVSRCEPSVSSGERNPPEKSKVDKKPRRKEVLKASLNFSKRNGPEVGSLQAPGARKREWDNLFYFAPRERRVTPNIDGGSRSWPHHAHIAHRDRNNSGGLNKFAKQSFLRANCQFLVKAGKDYAPYFADPDLLVEWDDVEQVVVTMIGEGASCPICLGSPVAAKITRCGHIYCWSCVLHYLALSDNQERPCPICYESISKKDLKSVVARIHFDVDLGDVIEMELLRRHKDIMHVEPFHSHEATEAWNELYSKLLIISPVDAMEKIIDREFRELTISCEEDPNCPEVCFIHQAIQELTDRKNVALLSRGTVNENEEIVEANEASPPLETSVSEKDEYFHFYQESKGFHIFLHPLNFSMLSREFGNDTELWPRFLFLPIIDKEYFSANEESRKRWKFLRHLPISTPFVVVEADLSQFVSSEVMNEFSPQLGWRKARRVQRAKEEKKMEKIMAERERKLFQLPIVPHFEPQLDFPEFVETTSINSSTSESIIDLGSSLIESSSFFEAFLEPPTTTSFAQMAGRAAKPIPQMRKSPSYPMSGSSTISLSADNHNTGSGRRHSESEPESEDHVVIPEFRASMSDAITRALENVAIDGQVENSGKSKKKKNKGRVLFTTGMGSFK